MIDNPGIRRILMRIYIPAAVIVLKLMELCVVKKFISMGYIKEMTKKLSQ